MLKRCLCIALYPDSRGQAAVFGFLIVAALCFLPSVKAVSRLFSPPAARQATPTVTQFYPIASTPGATIVVVGSGFDAQNTQVFFGGASLIPATVTVVDSTVLRVTVPASSTSANINGYLTVRVNGVNATTQALASSASNPNNPNATFPEFVMWGDVTGNGAVQNSDVTLMQQFVQGQATPTARQVLAGNVSPPNSNGSRGDGAALATADTVAVGAVNSGQATFCPCGESGVIRLSGATYSVTEGTPNVTVTIQRVGGSGGDMTVNYATSNGTATAGSDYTATSGSVTFNAGDTTPKNVTIPIVNNTVAEGAETFNVTLTTPVGSAPLGTPNTAVVTITDDDAAGQLALSAATYTVGEAGGTVTVTVTRSGGSTGTVGVSYATANGTATAGVDYTATSGTLTFAGGETSKAITIPILEDSAVEANETLTVTLSNPTGGVTLGTPSSATVTITDNDTGSGGGVLELSEAETTADEGDGTATVTVTRSNGSTGAVGISYATANGTATAGADYTATSGTLAFADGETSKTITVSILEDTLSEANETLTVTLSSPTGGATLGTQSSTTVTVIDNDVAPQAQFRMSRSNHRVREGENTNGQTYLTVVRIGSTAGTGSVQYSTTGLSATPNVDYSPASGTLTFAPGETTKIVAVTIFGDAVSENNETFLVNLSNPSGGTLGTPSSSQVTITNNSGVPPTISGQHRWSVSAYAASEEVGSIIVAVTRTDGAAGPISVVYETQDGTAVAGSDYTTKTGGLSWLSGDSVPKFITIPITTDGLVEGNETFNLILTGPYVESPSTAVVTIADDGAAALPGTLSFAEASYQTTEGGPNVAVRVNRVGGTSGTVGVNYATVNGTATAELDYTAKSGTLTFGPGETTKTFTLPILEDLEYEGDEALTVTLSSPTGGATLGTPATTTVTITENDPEPPPPPPQVKFSTVAYSFREGGIPGGSTSVTLTVERAGTSSGTVGVTYSTTAVTATAGSDYTPQSGTVTFGPGETSKGIEIPILDDSEFEGDEKFSVVLSNPTGGAEIGAPAGTIVTIADDEPIPAPEIKFSMENYSCREGETNGLVVLTVVRTGDPSSQASIDYTTVNGTAKSGQDYLAESGTITFEAGESARMITVGVYFDQEEGEPDQIFRVQLSNPTGATLVSPSQATVTIRDNSATSGSGQIQFSTSNFIANELDGGVVVTLTRTGGAKGALTVNYTTANQSAMAGSDYTAVSGMVMWGDGDGSNKTILIPITPDAVVEGNEMFQVVAVGRDTATVMIADGAESESAGSLQLSQANYVAAEDGETASLQVIRLGGSVGTVGVTYATTSGTATAPGDYTTTSETLTLVEGETSKTFTIPIVDDEEYEGNKAFSVTLSNPTGGARLGTQVSSQVTIEENEAEPAGTLQFGSGGAAVNESAGSVMLSVYRTNGSGGTVTVDYATSNVTATSGTDYTQKTGTLTFADQETSKTIEVLILNDILTEGSETFKVTLSNPTGEAALGALTETIVTIGDDETAGTAPTLTQSPQGTTITPGQTTTLTVVAAGTAPLNYQWYKGSETGSGIPIPGATEASLGTEPLLVTTGYWVRVTNPYGVIESAPAFVNVGNCNPINLSPTAMATGKVGTAYNQTLTASGGVGPYDFAVTFGVLPAGLTLGEDGVLAGTPTASGTANFIVRATDAMGCIGTRTYALTVNAAGCPTISLSPGTLPDATVNEAYTTTVSGSGGSSPYTFTLEAGSTLPAGLSLSATGTLSGTPTATGSSSFTVRATDANGCAGAASCTLMVNSAGGGIGAIDFTTSSLTVSETVGTVTVTIRRPAGSSGTASVTLTVGGMGTATGNGVDYTLASPQTVTFGSSELTKTVAIPIQNDALGECDETVVMTLSSPTGGATLGPNTTLTLTITDNDTALDARLERKGSEGFGFRRQSGTWRSGVAAR